MTTDSALRRANVNKTDSVKDLSGCDCVEPEECQYHFTSGISVVRLLAADLGVTSLTQPYTQQRYTNIICVK